jgi:hypothetical protein
VAAQCRYALIRGSVNPRVEEPPRELPALMVANRLWTPQRAEAAVRRIRHDWSRMAGWIALVPHLDGPARENATRAALDEARKQPQPEDRARALLEVMPVLSPPEPDAVLSEAVELIGQAKGEVDLENWGDTSLIELFPHLDDSRRADLLRRLVNSSSLVRQILTSSRSPAFFTDDGLLMDLAACLGANDYRAAVRLVLDGDRDKSKLNWIERPAAGKAISPSTPVLCPLHGYRGGL